MSHVDNIKRWQEFVKSKGWSKQICPTPHDWLLNKMGLECPPAIFWSPWIIGILSGTFFAIFWGIFMYLTVWSDRAFYQVSIPSISCGILIGTFAMALHWYQRRKLGIMTWQEFVKQNQD